MEDQAEIAQLALRFADAVNRIDHDAFAAVWSADSTWTIDPPTDFGLTGSGTDIAGPFVEAMRARWEFFVQLVHGTLATVDGDRATARSYCTEHARGVEGNGYFNYGVYDDELVRTPHGWRFSSRHYKYLYVDTAPPAGQAFPRP